ncbi:sodium/myo-inositol cotransporter 2-like isoform X2 [Acanthaster planci]|nr:sodium/myo-inositol cotransporter 2-like isoform X2 [Acanthaster planci]XP_022109016.1 sodium/myo-inositol cotransporter 2-like isoform X2 [Acanthaster planci]
MEQLVLVAWDYTAIVIYIVLVLLMAAFSIWGTDRGSKEGYFLGARSMSWLGIGASLFASSMSFERIISLTGGGAATGLAAAATEILALPFLLVLGWVFAPVYITSNVYSLPQYIHRRFGGQRIRILLAIIYLVIYIGVRISVNLYAVATFLQSIFPNWSIYVVIIPMVLVVALYTVPGGLGAVISTQIVQTFVIIAGSSVLAVFAYMEVGGYSGMKERYLSQMSVSNDSFIKVGQTCGFPEENAFYVLRDPGQSNMPWAAFLFGYSSNALWMWCADQLLVQKTMSAKNLSHAQGGCILAGYLKILPMFLLVIPGMISRTLYANAVGCATAKQCLAACGNPRGCAGIALPMLIMGLLPQGLHGVLLVVMLAAAMSDLSSVFNSAATIITIDIVGGVKKYLMSRWSMAAARTAILVMLVISFAWVPAVHFGVGLTEVFTGILKVQFGFAPSIAAVFLLAIVWPRANEKGSFFALLTGVALGIVHIACSIAFPEPRCGTEDNRPMFFQKVHTFYITLIIFVITIIVDIIVSLCTAAPEDGRLVRTVFWRRHSSASAKSCKVEKKKKLQTPHTDPFQLLVEEDAYEDEMTHWRRKSKMRLCYEWACGYASYDVTPRPKRSREAFSMAKYKAVDIRQSPCTKVFLNINLVIVLLAAITMFSLFSLPANIMLDSGL